VPRLTGGDRGGSTLGVFGPGFWVQGSAVCTPTEFRRDLGCLGMLLLYIPTSGRKKKWKVQYSNRLSFSLILSDIIFKKLHSLKRFARTTVHATSHN